MLSWTSGLRRAFTIVPRRFVPSRLDGVEDLEDYKPGGFHPILIGDTFDQGRLRVLHKLGYGGSCTVWLARNQQANIVTLKALRANIFLSNNTAQIPELSIAQRLKATKLSNFHTVDHHFFVHGPNGIHLFLVTPFAGPSISSVYDCPGRTIGSRRLRADLARKVAKQTAESLYAMHCAGIVHGDLTTSNILFRPSTHVLTWSDAEVYAHLGEPETEVVMTCDGRPAGPHAPAMLVEPVPSSRLSNASLLEDDVIISDFGQSYLATSPPAAYRPATLINYMSPESRFTWEASFAADIWSLGCAIFEIRAGFPLFDSFLVDDHAVLMQTIKMLGRPPDAWWDAYRKLRAAEEGQPKSEAEQNNAGMSSKGSIREMLLEIGKNVDTPFGYEERMMEGADMQLSEGEVDMLADLLGKMLVYRPEQRIGLPAVIQHPWLISGNF